METYEAALSILLGQATPLKETEDIPLQEALGRIVAQAVASPIAVPPFDRSPLDGYALHSADIAAATRENPVALRVIGEACAGCGETFAPGRGEALRLMTGAPVPPMCDCVIRQEDTDEGMDTVRIYASVAGGQNICRAGEDIAAGSVVMQPGEKITFAHIGVLASLGIVRVCVYRRVRVALLCTGDELAQPGETLTPGKIYDANGATLTARLTELGTQVNVLQSEADDATHVAQVLKDASAQADILITTGGVSVGKKDIFHQVLPQMGAQKLFWKIAMKPGSPLLCATYAGKLLICLSGNPFAALACFELFAKPVLRRLSGQAQCESPRLGAVLADGFLKGSPTRRFVRAYFDGQKVHIGTRNHSSGALLGMIGCNCLIDIPAGSKPLSAGDEAEIVML